ncbi:short-chain dehydrogenase [Biscogniauxia marginata]|nr:short-chain dehydrogenase [Biscogniauxia marginata]
MAKHDRLEGKHVFVIGGSKGIGRGIVEAALAAGARVTLSGSTQHSADAAVASIRAAQPPEDDNAPLPLLLPLVGIGSDLSRDTVEEDLDALLAAAAGVQPIDHIVLTAADGLAVSDLADLSAARVRDVAHMRMLVPVLLGKLAPRYLLASSSSSSSEDKSLTLTTGGIADRPQRGWSLMSYVMAGANALARNLALDLAPRAVRVNAVEPGAVDTPLWGPEGPARDAALEGFAARLPLGRVASPADVAEAYVYLMRDRNATGEVVKTRGGAQLV